MTRIAWTPLASGDLEAIDDYCSAYSLESAELVATKIEVAATFLADVPKAGPLLEDGRARKWRVTATPYLLIYRIAADRIEILRVYHERMNWREDA